MNALSDNNPSATRMLLNASNTTTMVWKEEVDTPFHVQRVVVVETSCSSRLFVVQEKEEEQQLEVYKPEQEEQQEVYRPEQEEQLDNDKPEMKEENIVAGNLSIAFCCCRFLQQLRLTLQKVKKNLRETICLLIVVYLMSRFLRHTSYSKLSIYINIQ